MRNFQESSLTEGRLVKGKNFEFKVRSLASREN